MGAALFDQKQQQGDDSEHCLKIIDPNKAKFFCRCITMNETWIHHYTPEGNRQSVEWNERSEPHPKRATTQQSAGEVMAPVFWDAQGMIFINHLKKAQTTNSDYYIELLDQLGNKIAEKRSHLKKKVLSHEDNAPCHT